MPPWLLLSNKGFDGRVINKYLGPSEPRRNRVLVFTNLVSLVFSGIVWITQSTVSKNELVWQCQFFLMNNHILYTKV